MTQRQRPYVIGIVLLALALRLPCLLSAQVVLTEGTTYTTIARSLAAGRGYVGILGVVDFFVPPLYPLLMAGLARLGLDAVWAGRLLSLILGTLLPLPVYWLTKNLSGRRSAGLFSALLIAAHPLLVVYASRVWSETTYSFLIWCGLCFAWASLKRGKWIAAGAAGLCFGAAYLTRHEGAIYQVVFLVLLGVLWVWETWQSRGGRVSQDAGGDQKGSGRAKYRLTQAVASLVAFALLAVPYVIWLSGQGGRLMWETKSVPNFVTAQRMAVGLSYTEAAYGLTPSAEPAGPFLFRNELLRKPPATGDLALVDRVRTGLDGLQAAVRLVLTEISSPLATVLALFGLLAGHWGSERLRRGRGFAVLFAAALFFLLPGLTKPLALLLLIPVCWRGWDRHSLASVGYPLVFLLPTVAVISLVPRVYTRYLTPLVGYVALWAGIGLAGTRRWAREEWADRPRWAGSAELLLSLFVVVVVVHSIQGGILAFWPPLEAADLDQRIAGEWLAAYDASSDKRIMSVHSQLPFYAGGVHAPLPYASPELVQRYAENQDVDYVVVSARKLRSRAPLEVWTRGEGIPEAWQSIYEDRDADLTIYRRSWE